MLLLSLRHLAGKYHGNTFLIKHGRTWWYSGIVAIFLQFAVVDPLFSIAHYFVYRANKKLGLWCHKARAITQGYNELFLNSEDEREDKKQRKKSKAKAHTDIEKNPVVGGDTND